MQHFTFCGREKIALQIHKNRSWYLEKKRRSTRKNTSTAKQMSAEAGSCSSDWTTWTLFWFNLFLALVLGNVAGFHSGIDFLQIIEACWNVFGVPTWQMTLHLKNELIREAKKTETWKAYARWRMQKRVE